MTGAGAIGSLFVFARRGTRRRRGEGGRSRGSPADRQLAVAALLTTLAAVTVVLGSDVYEFSWRYQLPALVTLPLAGVFGAMVIARRFRLRPGRRARRQRRPRRIDSAPCHDRAPAGSPVCCREPDGRGRACPRYFLPCVAS